MTKERAIRLFHDKKVRVHWEEDKEKYFFNFRYSFNRKFKSKKILEYTKNKT